MLIAMHESGHSRFRVQTVAERHSQPGEVSDMQASLHSRDECGGLFQTPLETIIGTATHQTELVQAMKLLAYALASVEGWRGRLDMVLPLYPMGCRNDVCLMGENHIAYCARFVAMAVMISWKGNYDCASGQPVYLREKNLDMERS